MTSITPLRSLWKDRISCIMFRVRWPAWKPATPVEQKRAVEEAAAFLEETGKSRNEESALFSPCSATKAISCWSTSSGSSTISTKLNWRSLNLGLAELLEQTTSYLSVVELGLYEASVRLFASLKEKGMQPATAEWNRAMEAELSTQREAAAPRLWSEIPPRRYLCLYR